MASRFFVIIDTADALAPNRRQDNTCANADLSLVDYVETKSMIFSIDLACFGLEKVP